MAPEAADVIVVGAGVVGASSAYFLSDAGFRVILIDQAGVAAGTSSAGQSIVGAGVGALPMHDYFKAGVSTYSLLREKGFDLGYQQIPSLVVAADGAEQSRLVRVVDELCRRGGECELLDRAQVLEIEPRLSGRFVAVARETDTAQVNPMRVTLELVQASARNGAQVHLDEAVTAVTIRGGRFHSISTSKGTIEADHLVIAAGVWSRAIGGLVGLNLPVWPRKGHIVVSEPLPGWLRHLIVEFGYEASLGQGFGETVTDQAPEMPAEVGTIIQPLPSGQLLIGSSREISAIDRSASPQRLRQIIDRAREFVPDIGDVRAIRCYAGLRPWTPDGRPLIGPCERIQGLHLATGHGGGGITGGPLAGRVIADQLAGKVPVVDPAPMRPDRYGERLYATAAGQPR